MQDVLNIINNIESIYENNTAFKILKDFERVFDELDLYVYKNWEDGELVSGPLVEKHWVTCSFMWPLEKMPDPMGGKRLVDYDCKVRYHKDKLLVARRVETPDDFRPGTRKGKLDQQPVWVVEIQMPIALIKDMYAGYVSGIDMPTQVSAENNPAISSGDEYGTA